MIINSMTRRALTVATFCAALPAMAQEPPVRIGYLSDMSGAGSSIGGASSFPAIEMAIEDFGGEVLGRSIDYVSADQLNKPDVGLGVAREWLDQGGVTMILDANNSAVSLAVGELTARRKVIYMSGGSTMKLTNEACNRYMTQWIPDTYALAHSLAKPIVEGGNDKWFFIAVDYAFGHDLAAQGKAAVEAAGGTVLGVARHSPQTSDYSAFLLEAQASGADTVALATFGSYMVNLIKQANEFGMEVKLVPFFLSLEDIHSIGLDNMHNVTGTTAFYWDRTDASRAWSARYEERFGRPATFLNAQQYSAVTHYLKSVAQAGTTDGDAVADAMMELAVGDATDISAVVRPDGRVARDMYLIDVKSPADSVGQWDLARVVATVDKADASLPLEQSTCPLVTAGE
ncbi:ABC transporter substrate-binding protein [Paracoccus sp. (in: a-proteobacteria)]|uniref:ABC transporter substrate-binding protein n=1 Tax=Paracoccus sp. TaxID=267 RepID=UPI003A890C28